MFTAPFTPDYFHFCARAQCQRGCSGMGGLSQGDPIVGCYSLGSELGGQSWGQVMGFGDSPNTTGDEPGPAAGRGPARSRRRLGWSWSLQQRGPMSIQEKWSKTRLETRCLQWGSDVGQCWMGHPDLSWSPQARTEGGGCPQGGCPGATMT